MSASAPRASSDAVRDGVVAFVPDGRILVVGGSDRVRFLHAVTAAEVEGLEPGGGVFGALTDDRGHPVSSFHLYVLPEAVLLELPSGRAETAREALERLVIADDVTLAWAAGATVGYESADAALLAATMAPARGSRFVAPPEALAGVTPAVGYAAGSGEPDPEDLASLPLRREAVLRASRLGGFGALHWALDGDRAGELAALATRRDAKVKIALSPAEREPLEIEAGAIGVAEIEEAKVWNELDAMDAVSLTKGCWMGQEIVRRVHALGELQRKRTGVVLDAPHGQGWARALLEDEAGVPAGVVTRAARSRALGATVAQAFVRRAHWAPGSRLVAVRPADGARASATVAALPFVQRAAVPASVTPSVEGEAR